jgi:hypothetical protein
MSELRERSQKTLLNITPLRIAGPTTPTSSPRTQEPNYVQGKEAFDHERYEEVIQIIRFFFDAGHEHGWKNNIFSSIKALQHFSKISNPLLRWLESGVTFMKMATNEQDDHVYLINLHTYCCLHILLDM